MKIKVSYSGKNFKLTPYTTKQEKDLLISTNFENYSLDGALEICGMEEDQIKDLSRDEKVFLLYMYRTISVGDDMNFKFTCIHCDSPNENILTIGNMVTSSNIKNDKIVDRYKKVTYENIQEFLNIDIDELDLDEYENIFEEIDKSVTKFNFSFPIFCQKCRKENFINLNRDDKFIIENLSEQSISTIYKMYNDLVYNSNYSKIDIDSMLPFERTILINLLNKSREDNK
jgi:hypothetical protein